MLKTDELVQTSTGSAIQQWASHTLDIPSENVHLRWRGNALHVLCESETCPQMAIAVPKFTQALKACNFNSLLPPEHPHIYELYLYGRSLGAKRPDWSVRLDPLRPDSPATVTPAAISEEPSAPEARDATPQGKTLKSLRWSPYNRVKATAPKPSPLSDLRMMLCAQSRASMGDEEAEALLAKGITRYLNETPSASGVSVKALVKGINDRHRADATPSTQKNPRRLWLFCQGGQELQPSTLVEPLYQKLRELQLEGFRDAVFLGPIAEDKKPEWFLRFDLTSREEKLKQAARWGDIPALTELVNRAIADRGLEVASVQKDYTLHLFCGNRSPQSDLADFAAANKQAAIEAIAPLLKSLAPQGIQAVTLYGCPCAHTLEATSQAPPLWVDWLELSAARNPALAPSTTELAQQGNAEALKFLLDRLVNRDRQLQPHSGDISILLRYKDDVLHLMFDAPTCPSKAAVIAAVVPFLQELNLEGIDSVRLYGRCTGQKQPLWRDRASLNPSLDRSSDRSEDRSVNESSLELPPSSPVAETAPEEDTPSSSELIVFESEPPELFGETTVEALQLELPDTEDLQACLTKQAPPRPQPRRGSSTGWLTRLAIQTGLFIPNKAFRRTPPSSSKVALIWGTLGLLLTLHVDWWIGHQEFPELPEPTTTAISTPDPTPESPATAPENPSPRESFPPLSLNNPTEEREEEEDVFNGSSFTETPEALREESSTSEIFPTFNSQQLDEQLRLYIDYVATTGAPDVLIVGSSRALRGVAPMTLEQALADRYPGLKVFNFGINGATAQVVDFVVRQLLPQDRLPKLILWADGARGFNSGRPDRTFEAISRSPGYAQISQGIRPMLPQVKPIASDESNTLASLTESLANSARNGFSVSHNYQKLDKALVDRLGSLSASYPQRDRFMGFLRTQLLVPLAQSIAAPSVVADGTEPTAIAENNSESVESHDSSLEQSIVTFSEEAAAMSATENNEPSALFNGFLPLSVRFNPSTYYEKHARVSGDYDADYESFQLAGIQTAALKNMLEFTRDRQIPVVFVNMPLTEDYLDPIRMEYEREFQKYMLTLSMETEGISFRDLSQLWPTQTDRFSDPSHLNRYGAYEVSNRLSQDPMIPWPQVQ